MLRNLRKEFGTAIGSSETAIRIDTDEVRDCIKTLYDVCLLHGWEMRVFDVTVGTKWMVGKPPDKAKQAGGKPQPTVNDAASFLDAVAGPGGAQPPPSVRQCLVDFWRETARADELAVGEVRPVVLVVKNLHLAFERDREAMVSLVAHLVGDRIRDQDKYQQNKATLYDPYGIEGSDDTGKFLVGIMPAEAQLPPEVDPLFRNLVHELPDEEEISVLLTGSIKSRRGKVEKDDEDDTDEISPELRKKICRFALGLTRLQIDGIFAASQVLLDRVDPQYVWEQKSEILNKEGLVTLYQGKEKYAEIAGLDGAKDFLKRLLTPDKYDDADPDVRAKGIVCCGAPGVGKSALAKAAGNELGLPTLMVQPGNWFGSLVGDTEAKTRKAFQIIRAHAPAIAIVDEADKVMPSSRGGGGDSGVGARMEGTFLTNMNDMTEPPMSSSSAP